MWYSQSLACPQLFVCTAILCWNANFLNYSFVNITNCTPSPLYFQTDMRLILRQHTNHSRIQKNYSIKGFVCSNCTRHDLIEYNLNPLDQCSKQTTMIELRNYCHVSFRYQLKKNICQCFPATQPIQPIKDWVKALIKPGKSHMNIVRANNINTSVSISVYFLVGFVLLLVLLGGMAGMIFYWVKLKSMQRRTLK